MQPEPKVNILLVDDYPENLLALEAILSGLGENLVRATSGQEALRCLLNLDFAVILLDVQMPGMNGFETADLIRSRARTRQTPIIFLTAFNTDDEFVFKGYALGAVDYLHKPIDPVILTSKVSVFVDLFRKTEMLRQQTEEVRRQAAQLSEINNELRRSEERFRLLSVCSPVGIFVTDNAGYCTYTNPRCQTICGFSLENSLNEAWLKFVHPEDRNRVSADWLTYIGDGHEYSDEFRLQVTEGSTRWVHVRSTPMFSDQNEPLGHVGTIEDITERKQMEAARNQIIREQVARREAEASSRMKDEFLAVLSHELRTPLNAMLGWSRLLRTRKFDEQTTARALETIERNANTQAQLIEDILDVSKIIRGKLRLNYAPVKLISVLEAAIDSVRPQAEAKSIQLETALDASIEQIWGDSVRLQQIAWNLLSNAIKFTPDEGRVEVKLSLVHNQPSAKENKEENSNPNDRKPTKTIKYAQIQVIDTGIGISPDFLPNVFDRFRQADSTTTRAHNGLGLGLAIVRHLVELHGGHVLAESAGEGKGATFTVELPLQMEKQTLSSVQKEPSPAIAPTCNLKKVTILVVDDEADTREFITFALRQYGAIITQATSVRDALATLNMSKPDLLVSDIGMPDEDGYMLIRQIRQFEQDTGTYLPAIALTAYSRDEDHQKALSEGFDAHFAKPVEVTELVQAIAQLLKD
ncbi:MAG: response regulator [Cyanobacteria bacterium CRU_2_1]|nr:response regulator [Cyanobacteria bacterium CRU_2_1]